MSAATTTRPPSSSPDAGTLAARRDQLRACTLLLVDDEEGNLDLLEGLLAGEGYEHLLRTTDPREVVTLVDRHAVDLVLLDLHMPLRHGLDVLADLRATTPEGEYRPVLVLTADVTADVRDRALAFGARDFLTKPFDVAEVVLRVENLLDTRVLHLSERHARERAEAAESRAALLAEWSRILAASLDPAAAAAHLPRLVVPRWAAACEARLDGAAPAASGPGDGSASLRAPVATGDGIVGTVVLSGAGSGPGPLVADQALVDDLASRLGLAVERAGLLAAAELAVRERERLLAVVAHDLRNPLGAVAMYAEVLASLQAEDADPYARGALATIHTTTAGMQRLVEDLLDMSSLRGGALRVHRTEQRIGGVFEEADRMLRPLADAAGVALVVEPEPGAPGRAGPVDARRLVQLLSNLVSNAVQFTPPGGAVTVRYSVDADGLDVSVADTGPGIAADDLSHLFTAFWRGDRRPRDAHRGAGLGLWIARAIVEGHGGTLRVETRPEPEPAHGTTFHVTIPFADARRWED